MDKKAPAFQFYPSDFLADERVALMSNREVGCYIKLMCYCWREGSIPDCIQKIARLCGETEQDMTAIWEDIKGCFKSNGNDRLIHPRLERERTKQENYRKKKSRAGYLGANSKWNSEAMQEAKRNRSERLSEARKKGQHTKEQFQEMVNFFGGQCVKCGTEGDILKDHIIPIYQGGSDGIDNLQPLCKHCNSKKGVDSTDYRLIVCEQNKLNFPNAWQTPSKRPTERLANDGSSSSSSTSVISSNEDICPHQEIISLYHNTLPECPKVKTWTEKRKKKLRARWREDGKHRSLSFWQKYFENVRLCFWFTGKNERGWYPDLEWLIEQSHFVSIWEKKYLDRGG